MASVAALYRYPVKGFTPEPRERIVVQDDGRVEGDRVLAFRFADAVEPEDEEGLEYWPKKRGLALMDMPSLARLRLSYDSDRGHLAIRDGERVLVDAVLDDAGRRQIEDAVTAWLRETPDVRHLKRPGRLPLRLIGDGVTSQFQDRPRGYVSVHAAASVVDLGRAADAVVDDRRFRSNVVIEGIPPWRELEWQGRVRIGDVIFAVQRPIVRCAAIMANPDTGLQDAPLLRILTREFGQSAPTLGVLLLPESGGGTLRVGDPVESA
ncbi:MOSC domain-containing protein [Microbacterium schleiferi]|uniref:MOSC domain-containing protein n=1 Tax=Microbacterium schleiferi TaxID=69362 RepID=UPI00311ED181